MGHLWANHKVALAAAILFIAACMLPALTFQNTNTNKPAEMSGMALFFLGPLAIFAGQFSWLANPMLIAAAIFYGFRRYPLAAGLSGGAVLVGLSALFLFKMSLPANEGGVGELKLTKLEPGFYLWMASLATFTAAAVWKTFPNKTV